MLVLMWTEAVRSRNGRTCPVMVSTTISLSVSDEGPAQSIDTVLKSLVSAMGTEEAEADR